MSPFSPSVPAGLRAALVHFECALPEPGQSWFKRPGFPIYPEPLISELS